MLPIVNCGGRRRGLGRNCIGELPLLHPNLQLTKLNILNNDYIDTTTLDKKIVTNDCEVVTNDCEDDVCEPPQKKVKVDNEEEELEGFGKKRGRPKKNKRGKKGSKKKKKICVTVRKPKKKKKKVTTKSSIRGMIGRMKTNKLKRDIYSYLR